MTVEPLHKTGNCSCSSHQQPACAYFRMGYCEDKPVPVGALPTPTVLTLCRNYFTQVYPARGHGATDCGEYLDGSAGLPDGDHFLGWLWERGFKVVPL